MQGKHVVQLISTLLCPSPLFSQVLVFDQYDGTLNDLRPSSDQLCSILFQLLLVCTKRHTTEISSGLFCTQGVKECHAEQYIHMDIREENIFYKRAKKGQMGN